MKNILRRPDLISEDPVEAGIQSETFVLTPKLIFGTQHDIENDKSFEDIFYFPTFSQVQTKRGKKNDVRALNCFINSIKKAQHRIWIFDGYLFKPEGKEVDERLISQKISQILEWFDEEQTASSIRFMTRKTDGLDELDNKCKQHAQLINSIKVGSRGGISIDLKYLPEAFEVVHDRFAIIDNELWHFGAAAAGLNSGLNASSRGWDANALKAIIFFDEVWSRAV